ncbi:MULTISPECIES: hypothetical protein [unclassified Microbacterium]|uniref:hypothetical protein n=1 Tax=unclassified Microbacterium TaxID=2609290 RepID=UPI000F86E9CD|nr:hypothetical protein [Microbacterium sp. HSID17254]RUQ07439.1 hypothetical protein D8M34_03435 [Microbacterium sp. HSID17254]
MSEDDRDRDPTRMANQPALRTSSGAVWLIVATIFTAVSLVPLIGIVRSGGAAGTVGLVTAIILVLGLAAMVVIRLAVSSVRPRLRALAAGFLAMALLTLVGITVCVLLVGLP